ncbi:MAG: methylthioribose kinaselike, partial [Gammaproteobacteria bacterium]|nr:methylthioribose kinaselike [Gammaproteobacteria bacterium]
DLGAFFGNLLLSWYSQPGYATPSDDRSAYQEWILGQARSFWETFHRSFLALWADNSKGDVFPVSMFSGPGDDGAIKAAREEFMDRLFADMLGFGACKMIRRIIGFAHVIDFERIVDTCVRADCEAGALNLARMLLTNPEQFKSINDVIEAVPRMTVQAQGSA